MFVERGLEVLCITFNQGRAFLQDPLGGEELRGVLTRVLDAEDCAGDRVGGCGREAGSVYFCLSWGFRHGHGHAKEANLWSRHVQNTMPG